MRGPRGGDAHYGDGRATTESIRAATRNALRAADERDCESIVFPALGCGVAGFDLDEGVQLIAEEIARFDADSLTDVRLIGYSDAEYEAMRAVASAVRTNERA